MCEVLAHPAALLEESLDRSGDLGRLGIEVEIAMYFSHKVANSFQHRTPRGKDVARIVGEFAARAHALRAEDKLISVQAISLWSLTIDSTTVSHGRGRGEIRASWRCALPIRCVASTIRLSCGSCSVKNV